MELEDPVKTCDVKDSQEPFAGADDVQRAVVGANSFERTHEHAEASRIEEGHLFDIHNQSRVSSINGRNDDFPQFWRGVDIDFSGDLNDVKTLEISFKQRQVHASIEPAKPP